MPRLFGETGQDVNSAFEEGRRVIVVLIPVSLPESLESWNSLR
jgi:hypothetical protein